jgi:hypothetical protein
MRAFAKKYNVYLNVILPRTVTHSLSNEFGQKYSSQTVDSKPKRANALITAVHKKTANKRHHS